MIVTEKNVCVETYETMHNTRNDVWWSPSAWDVHAWANGLRLAKLYPKRTTLGYVNFAPRAGALRNCQG